nr:MAG TPA: hypothetical protein [Caudoviricetes sp.]
MPAIRCLEIYVYCNSKKNSTKGYEKESPTRGSFLLPKNETNERWW